MLKSPTIYPLLLSVALLPCLAASGNAESSVAKQAQNDKQSSSSSSSSTATATATAFKSERDSLVDKLLPGRGISDKRVLEAMRTVPRHLFVPAGKEREAYDFGNIQIGSGQVIGDPFIVALMTQSIKPKATDTVLEVGTGSGYQAAVLSRLVKQIYSIEIVPDLEKTGKARLERLGYKNVQVKLGDGYEGWSKHAPFDAIVVTSHPSQIPIKLVNQLKVGGKMILPVGGKTQRMQLVTKLPKGMVVENVDMAGLVITGRY